MLDKNEFFETYDVQEEFEKSELKWETLEEIYDDYVQKENDLKKCIDELTKYIQENMAISVHSIRGRYKDPFHLIEKIIRKRGKEQSRKYRGINKSNYTDIVRDLIGLRILILAKEEWKGVFGALTRIFPDDRSKDIYMAEPPVAYTRYGDRDLFEDLIRAEHSNKGYRSQHYIVYFKGYFCEIQVRTLSEEVYGEFDHRVKYPYRDDNKFLIRYTKTLSQLLGSVDELLSTCFQMEETGWDNCNQYYEEDKYIDWSHISQKTAAQIEQQKERSLVGKKENYSERIAANLYAKSIILRKEKEYE